VPRELVIHADPDDFALVLNNLVGNAAEAQPRGGRVQVSAGAVPGGVEIFVEDAGPGVPEELRGRVFEALFTTKARGTGLGLALCRRVVIAHGGEIGLLGSDSGARFRIFLPLAEPRPAPESGPETAPP
jgi:two-component system, NtrC family, sensor histidine kinase HydH